MHDLNDVVICGGGVAGLLFARQLKMEMPDLCITILEKSEGPCPLAAHKVGESANDIGAHYLAHDLGLYDYLNANHIPKLGLRWFFGTGDMPFVERAESGPGVGRPSPSPTFQIDRGRFENDLRRMVMDVGVDYQQGCVVENLALAASDSDDPHEVTYRQGNKSHTIRGRWVADGTGRRKLLQSQLGLSRDSGHHASASWFRVDTTILVDDFVPQHELPWHMALGFGPMTRSQSTCHIMGKGYWIWVIPLRGGCTSIGICADEALHPVAERSTAEKTFAWLEKNDPVLHHQIKLAMGDRQALDFHALKNFSYRSDRVISPDRWVCLGDAAFFVDPFFSPGFDLIGYTNTSATELIKRDRQRTLTPEVVDSFNRLLCEDLYDYYMWFTRMYEMGTMAHVGSLGFQYITYSYFGTIVPMFVHQMFRRPELHADLSRAIQRQTALDHKVANVLSQWTSRLEASGGPPFDLRRYNDRIVRAPMFIRSYQRVLQSQFYVKHYHAQLDGALFLRRWADWLDVLQEYAQAIFFRALAETAPDQLSRFEDRWVNAWSVDLDPETWTKEGLMSPEIPRRSLERAIQHVRDLCEPGPLTECNLAYS